jgi:ornithine cyclodeaminase/alanine dehydrogenase-like protein (mu-crystallin family)
VHGADLIVTVTPSTVPLISRADVDDAATIVAVGSDGEGKRELATDILDAATLVADDPAVARERGELQYLPNLPAVALGSVVSSRGARPEGIVVVDLVGLGAQDAAISGLALAALQRTQPEPQIAPSVGR